MERLTKSLKKAIGRKRNRKESTSSQNIQVEEDVVDPEEHIEQPTNICWTQNKDYEWANVRKLCSSSIIPGHLSRNNNEVSWRGGTGLVKATFDALPPSVKNRVCRYPWKEFYYLDTHNEKQKILRTVCERYWKESNTFFFPNFEAGISPLDLYMITGIMCKGPEIPYNLPKWKTRWPERLPLLKQHNPSIRGEGMSVSDLRNFLGNYCAIYGDGKNDNPKEEQDEIERVFILWILSYSFFPNASLMAPFGFLETLENLDMAPYYDWGTVLLAEIHRSLRDVSSGSAISFDAYHHILEFWWYVHFKVNYPTLKQTQLQHPIMKMFAQDNWAKKQRTDGSTSKLMNRLQGAQRTTANYKGRPYSENDRIMTVQYDS